MPTVLKRIRNSIFSNVTLGQLLVGCFVLSLFTHVPLYTFSDYAYFLGEKKDFVIAFLWPSDILLFTLVCYTLKQQRQETPPSQNASSKNSTFLLIGALLLNVLTLVINWEDMLLPAISIYYFTLLYKGYVLHGTGLLGMASLRSTFEKVFTFAASGEAVLAILQFSQQRSIGFKYLGETILGPYLDGIAKIDTENLLFMRAYGTMPHPNILAGLLGIAIILVLRKIVSHATTIRSRITYVYTFQASLLLLGLVLTFSRAAWLATAIGALTLLVLEYYKRHLALRDLVSIIAYLSVTATLFLSILLPLVQPRSDIFDKAYTERVAYNSVGLSYISSAPFLGIGPGQSLLHMEQELGKNFKPWEIQPIHNYFVLYSAEFGLIALAFLILYFFLIIKRGIKKSAPEWPLYFSIIVLIGTLMLFDHYFMTLQPTVLIFWLISSYFFCGTLIFGTTSRT